MGDASIYDDGRKDDLRKALEQQGSIKSQLEDAEMEWMDLTEQLEDAD